jgi:hypothetical protein
MIACAAVALVMPAMAQAPAQKRGFEAFQGIRTRHIFDPDRRGPRVESAPSTTATKRPDFLALTGTMVTSGKTLAFFIGSRTEFNKVLAVREKIADYTVAAITPSHVELEKEGKPLTLAIGKQLAMDGSGNVSESTGASSAASSSTTPAGADMAPPPGVPADKAEVLRRMMERRNQEVSK